MVLDVFVQGQDRSVVDLEVVRDIKHEPSLPLLSHHKAEKEPEPSRPTLIMDLCTEQQHIYESGSSDSFIWPTMVLSDSLRPLPFVLLLLILGYL